ncbi:MAG TPA: hypothetical protein VF800_00995 [Telluria sp.]|jgi:hypothetical protein
MDATRVSAKHGSSRTRNRRLAERRNALAEGIEIPLMVEWHQKTWRNRNCLKWGRTLTYILPAKTGGVVGALEKILGAGTKRGVSLLKGLRHVANVLTRNH